MMTPEQHRDVIAQLESYILICPWDDIRLTARMLQQAREQYVALLLSPTFK